MASAGSFEALSQLAQSHHRATSDAPWSMMSQLPITSGSLPIGDAKALTRYTSVTEALRPGSFTFASDGALLPCTLPADVALVQPLLTAVPHAMSEKAQTSTAASMILPGAIQAAKSSPLPIASMAKAPTVKSPLSVKRESAAAAATSHGIEHDEGDACAGVDTRRSARIASIETYQAESAAAAERLEGLVDACMESSGSGAGMGTYEPSTSIVRVHGRLTRAAPQKEKSRTRLQAAASIDATSRAKGSKYADARREHELAAAEADGVAFELDETTINTRQFDAIIRRRGQRAEFDEYRRRIRDRGFLHESRSKHALRRVRGERGKFLSMEELAALEHAQMVARMAQEREQQGPPRKRWKMRSRPALMRCWLKLKLLKSAAPPRSRLPKQRPKQRPSLPKQRRKKPKARRVASRPNRARRRRRPLPPKRASKSPPRWVVVASPRQSLSSTALRAQWRRTSTAAASRNSMMTMTATRTTKWLHMLRRP
jgi:hypothetical protein